MEDKEVKLLSCWGSLYGLKAEIALNAKGIKYQYVEEDLHNKSQQLVSSNPVHKKVPVLIHNRTPICESAMIIEYMEEVWPATPHLLPEDPYDRYLVRFWSDFIERKWKEIIGPIFMARGVEERSALLKKAEGDFPEMGITIERGVMELEKRGLLYMKGKSCLQYMDVCFAPYVAWSGPIEKLFALKLLDSEKFPCMCRWIQNLLTNKVVNSTLPDSVELMEKMAGFV